MSGVASGASLAEIPLVSDRNANLMHLCHHFTVLLCQAKAFISEKKRQISLTPPGLKDQMIMVYTQEIRHKSDFSNSGGIVSGGRLGRIPLVSDLNANAPADIFSYHQNSPDNIP